MVQAPVMHNSLSYVDQLVHYLALWNSQKIDIVTSFRLQHSCNTPLQTISSGLYRWIQLSCIMNHRCVLCVTLLHHLVTVLNTINCPWKSSFYRNFWWQDLLKSVCLFSIAIFKFWSTPSNGYKQTGWLLFLVSQQLVDKLPGLLSIIQISCSWMVDSVLHLPLSTIFYCCIEVIVCSILAYTCICLYLI